MVGIGDTMLRFVSTLFLFPLLAGCAVSSGVIQLSPSTFKITATATISGGGSAAATRSVYAGAQSACAAQGKEFQVVSEASDSQMTGASVSLIFTCVIPGTTQ